MRRRVEVYRGMPDPQRDYMVQGNSNGKGKYKPLGNTRRKFSPDRRPENAAYYVRHEITLPIGPCVFSLLPVLLLYPAHLLIKLNGAGVKRYPGSLAYRPRVRYSLGCHLVFKSRHGGRQEVLLIE